MRLILAESVFQGHHLMYVRRLIDGLRPLVSSIIFLTEHGVSNTPEFQQHIAPVLHHITLDDSLTLVPTGSLRRYWAARLVHLADRIQHHRANHVILPTGDGTAVFAGTQRLLGKKIPWQSLDVEIEANLVRTYVGYPAHGLKGKFKRKLHCASLKRSPLHTLYMIDFVAYENLRRQKPAVAAHLSLMPDPLDPVSVPDRIDARRTLNLPTDGRLLGTVGYMEARKGIANFLNAFRHAPLNSTDRLLLAGRCNDETRQLIHSSYGDLINSQRLLVIDRYLPDADLLTAISAMDLVCTPYINHLGPSGVTIRAMALGRPVLSTPCGWAEQAIPRFGMGWLSNTNNPESFAHDLATRLDQAPAFLPTPASARLKRYLSPDNFIATWSQRLRQRLGLPPDQNLISWQWVNENAAP